jgi:hypothetical protein
MSDTTSTSYHGIRDRTYLIAMYVIATARDYARSIFLAYEERVWAAGIRRHGRSFRSIS